MRGMTTREFAIACGVTVRTVRDWISTGKIHCIKAGGGDKRAWCIPETEIDKVKIRTGAQKDADNS